MDDVLVLKTHPDRGTQNVRPKNIFENVFQYIYICLCKY